MQFLRKSLIMSPEYLINFGLHLFGLIIIIIIITKKTLQQKELDFKEWMVAVEGIKTALG